MIDPRKLHSEYGLDERLLGVDCAYCGAPPTTVDHVPSKVFLDRPLPGNLPVVPACKACNEGFSLDEEYLACFLECVVTGTADPDHLRRPGVAKALRHSPSLAARIASACANSNGQLVWTPEAERVENVVLKLARGHHLYELSTPPCQHPETLSVIPLTAMPPERRRDFESGASSAGWPEIGSRAFLRAAGVESFSNPPNGWVVVQQGRYRYSVDETGAIRIVLGEYLACAVRWE